MKLNFEQPFLLLDGKLVLEGEKVVTLKTIVLSSLLGQVEGDEKSKNSEEKVKRFELAVKLSKDSEVELSIAELSLIKTCVEKRIPQLTTLIHGQALAMIEGKETGILEA